MTFRTWALAALLLGASGPPSAPTTERAAVDQAVTKAMARLRDFGPFASPIRVHLLPSHAALADAVGKKGVPWLRAWARYDEVFVQAPHTWDGGFTREELDELVLHELAHCWMYQAAATAQTWRRKGIPLWFREGLATYRAGQGSRWPTLAPLAAFRAAHPDVRPARDAAALYSAYPDVAYGAAHHLFRQLVERHGEHRVTELLARMRGGAPFDAAFERTYGFAHTAYLDAFDRALGPSTAGGAGAARLSAP